MAEDEGSYTHVHNRDLYPAKKKVKDEDCSHDSQEFHLLHGESVEYEGKIHHSLASLSNYRFFVSMEEGFYNVPLCLIDSVEIYPPSVLQILCKDAQVIKMDCGNPDSCKKWHGRLLEVTRPVKSLKECFAFVHYAYYKEKNSHSAVPGVHDWFNSEYRRLGMDLCQAWRITECNSDFGLCATYPKLFIVPLATTDDELREVVKFRTLGRIPAVVWRHLTNGCVIARSSQPLVGFLGWRSGSDEAMVLAISDACARGVCSRRPQPDGSIKLAGNGVVVNGVAPGHYPSNRKSLPALVEESCTPPTLLVLDLRSYTTSLANKVKGGGCECKEYYPNCEIQYKGLPNIHTVRKSFMLLRNLLVTDDQNSFLTLLEQTQWLSYLSQLLSTAVEVVVAIHVKDRPVLVHCSDGWDRTSQVVSLAELMLDPYYRTIEGFRILIEREWLSFGHKFADRSGYVGADPNEKCPVFLQWLDCVHQLLRQFPCNFQFNEAFLLKLGHYCHAGVFGTFLGNSAKEREESGVMTDTLSAWTVLNGNNPDYLNYLYSESESTKVLFPATHIRNMLLWKLMYCGPTFLLHKHTPTAARLSAYQPFLPISLPSLLSIPAIGGSPPQKAESAPPTTLAIDGVSRGSQGHPPVSNHVSSETSLVNTPITLSGIPSSLNDSSSSTDTCTASPSCTDGRGTDGVQHLGGRSPGLAGSTIVFSSGSSNLDSSSEAVEDSPCRVAADWSSELPQVSVTSTGQSTAMVPTTALCEDRCVAALDSDGLAVVRDEAHLLMRRREEQYRAKISELSEQLGRARLEAASNMACPSKDGQPAVNGVTGDGEREIESCSAENTPSSASSWDCVDGTECQQVRWVPDHAATNCQKCSSKFWTGNRRHHCRSCGGVFCSLCSDFYCAVPHELLSDARVCEDCYSKLDGYIKSTSPHPV